MQSGLFKLDLRDFGKGLVTAGFVGIILPLAAMIQTPNFDIQLVNWNVVANLALNGAIVGMLSYLFKNFLSDNEGKFLGKIG